MAKTNLSAHPEWVFYSSESGRCTWRHDSVLQAIARSVKAVLNPTRRLYADLPGLRACSNPPATIPINLSTSSDRPDLVIVSGSDLTILELTIPANNMENIKNARDRKMTKHQQLMADLDSHPDTTSVEYTTLEIGSLGHHSSTAVHDLRTTCPSLSKQEAHKILTLSAKVAVGCSYHIFRARHSTEWDNHAYPTVLCITIYFTCIQSVYHHDHLI